MATAQGYDTGWLQVGPSKFEELAPAVAAEMNKRVPGPSLYAQTFPEEAARTGKQVAEKLDRLVREMVLYPNLSPYTGPVTRLSEERNVRVGYQVSGGGGGCWLDCWQLQELQMPFEGGKMFVTDMQAAFGFNPRDVPDDGLKFVIAQLTGLAKDYETAGLDSPVKLAAKIAECWNVLTERATAVRKARLEALNREYDKLYEQTHPKRKLDDIDAERKAILAELEPKG